MQTDRFAPIDAEELSEKADTLLPPAEELPGIDDTPLAEEPQNDIGSALSARFAQLIGHNSSTDQG